MTMRKVIIDTDPGIDDALAIMAAYKHADIEILGITSVAGNKGLDYTTTNAGKLSTYFGSEVKVYRGASNDYVSVKEGKPDREDHDGVHGADGMGSVVLPVDESVFADQSAIDFILETVNKYPGEVDIIALGPVTNIALAIDKDIETMKKVKSIHSMGGGVHRGNVTPVAEFNYWFDPTAVEVMFSQLGPHLPIHMVGLDVTHQGVIDLNDLTFMKYVGGDLGKVINDMMQDYLEAYWENNRYIGAVIHDLMTVVGYLYPEIYTETYHTNLQCVTDSEIAFGQCIVDLAGKWGLEKNAHVPMSVDVPLYKEKVIEILFGKEVTEEYKKSVLNA